MIDLAQYFEKFTALPGEPLPVAGYRRVDEADYRRFRAVSASLMKETTLAEAWHSMQPGTPKKRTKDLILGSLVHIACLEPWKFAEPDRYFVECPTVGVDTQAADDVAAANPDKLLVTPELLEQGRKILAAVKMHPEAQLLLSHEGHSEATGFYFDPGFSVWRKSRVDRLPTKFPAMIDVKTTRKPLHRWESECWEWGYFLQAAWYLAIHYVLTGERRRWFWIVLTKCEPFMCRVVELLAPGPGAAEYLDPVCKLRMARERLGLDESARIGHLPRWVNAAQQTLQLVRRGVAITPEIERELWPGYEAESPVHSIL